MKNVRIIFPHQLFQESPLLTDEGDIYLVEEFLFFNQCLFHQQKIAFQRASMKYYEDFLTKKGIQVHYISAIAPESDIRKLIVYLQKLGIDTISFLNPVDDWLLRRIESTCRLHNISWKIHSTPMFLNDDNDLKDFFNITKKKFFQTEFYKKERIKRNLLLDTHGSPLGGQWTFDTENRKKYPKGKQTPNISFPTQNTYRAEAINYTQMYFLNHVGSLGEEIIYPIGFEESKQWLTDFLKHRFAEFGDYEDAIVFRESILHHSLLSPLLNIGMLTPLQVIEESLRIGELLKIPLNSLEGFIRQIVGWREFIRGVYSSKGVEERTRNFWNFSRKIPKSFYEGNTGIYPIDVTIKKVLQTGYCHHIERLMVLGNFMLLCEFDPDEVYRWFMELFIDAYDWVMVPNVYGMSQFADGGMMSTKPYLSGSNYLMKMSDYPKGDWQEIWDALFWRFLDKQRDFFLKNPRLSMLVRTFDNWDNTKKEKYLQIANQYIKHINSNDE